MLKRTLILAVTVLAAQSGAALADNNWAFDDAYWKSPARSGAATSYSSGTAAGANAVNAQFDKYKHVDGFNY